MAEYLIQDETLKLLATGIRQKSGITAELTPKDMIKKLFALETETDTGLASGVNFYDYDGTLLHSYTLKEAQELTALPEAPTHNGITFAGWTHTLEEVNDTLTVLDVGATYNSESTQMTINLTEATTFSFYFNQSISEGVSIDWGDGSTAETLNGTDPVYASHSYALAGEYVVKLTPTEGTLGFGITKTNYNTLYNQNVYGGNTFGKYSASDVPDPNSLLVTKIVLGNNVVIGTSFYISALGSTLYSSAFSNCTNLKNIIISCGVTKIGDNTFCECKNLAFVIFPKNAICGRQSFYRNYALQKVIFASGFRLSSGSQIFTYCNSLASVILPASITTTPEWLFYGCTALKRIHCRSKTPPSFGRKTFYYVPSGCVMYVPLFSVDAYTNTIANGNSEYNGTIRGEPIL